MNKVPAEYRDLLRNALKEEKANEQQDERPLKRRKKGNKVLLTPVQRMRELKKNPPMRMDEHERYIIHIDDNDNDETDKDRTDMRNKKAKENISIEIDDDDDDDDDKHDKLNDFKSDSLEPLVESEEDEDIDSDDFEDVDLDGTSFLNNDNSDEDNLNITIKQHRGMKKTVQRATVVDKNERMFRRMLHLMHLFAMVGHGVSRNTWLSAPELLFKLQKQIPLKLKNELKQFQDHRIKTNVTAQSKTRKLLDLLRHLMEYWQSVWTIDSRAPVLYKKTWTEIKYPNTIPHTKKQKMGKSKFITSILTHMGSRDLAAQGFVALLRSINLPARLIFSIQPPDFTNMKKCENVKTDDSTGLSSPSKKENKSSKSHKQSESLLSMLRSKKAYTNKAIKTQAQKDDEFSEKFGAWPVFWVEVWDKDSKKYITIDPMVKKLIEVINWKSKLEPPMNCIRNNAWYVVGYDRLGGIRDITRRYAKEYNAKVRKKRITREAKWDLWWENLLKGACSKKRLKDNRVDKFEQIEFEELGLKEGMPSNVGDFKGHPIYVLESDLKFNEILMPKISCGGLSNKAKSKKASDGFIPVYKRSNVHIVRSSRGWFMRGRVLKMGERPLKIREKKIIKKGKKGTEDEFQLSDNDNENDDDDDDDDGRLYAEFQTEMYKPPPVSNGIIPKNAFKNIDVYEPWMIPEGCVHIKNKIAEKAAKLMSIEYAPAVVGFDFKGPRRDVNAKIEGIVTLSEYKDAVELICLGINDMEEEEEKMREDLINLRSWRVLLTKLKIRKRLAYEHGEIESGDENDKDESDNESEDNNSSEDFASGGFVFDSRVGTASNRTRSHFKNADEFGPEVENFEMKPDLSESDFDSDVEKGGFSIEQIDTYGEQGKNNELNNQLESSTYAPELVENDGDLAYNPDEGKRYDASDSDNSSEDDDNRMDLLDKEFADFETELNLNEQEFKKENEKEYNENNDKDIEAYKTEDTENNIEEGLGSNEEADNNNDDDDYEFEYTD
jgi:xeroderma pigmentosum group C-complementing protein